MCVFRCAHPVLWVREALLHSVVQLLESLTDEQGAVGCRLQDGGEQLGQVRLQETAALLNNIRFCLLSMQTCTATTTNHRLKKILDFSLKSLLWLSILKSITLRSSYTVVFDFITLPLWVPLYWGPALHISFLQRFGLLWGLAACGDIASQPPAEGEPRQSWLLLHDTRIHRIKSL